MAFGQQTFSLELIITNIKGLDGSIRIDLFKNEKDFLISPVARRVVEVTGPEVTVHVDDLPRGEYAIAVIHDANENDKLDSDATGIPSEGFGFGNNARRNFGSPPFKDAILVLGDKPVSQTVNLRYYF